MLTKSKLLSILVISLVIVNSIAISYIFFDKQHKKHRGKLMFPSDIISDKLNFNEVQKASFEKLRKEHADLNKKFRESINEKRDQLIESVAVKNDSLAEELSAEIGEIQKQIEMNNYRHFLSLQSLCNQHQLERFNEIIEDIQKHINRPEGPHPPPHHEH